VPHRWDRMDVVQPYANLEHFENLENIYLIEEIVGWKPSKLTK
jgi:hypothetical protein